MCFIIGCVLSNTLPAGFPGGWIENRGFLCLLLLFYTCISWGAGGKAPDLHERRRTCGSVASGTWTQKPKENKRECFRKPEFCRADKHHETNPSYDPGSVWKEDHVQLLSVGLARTPPRQQTSISGEYISFWPDPAQTHWHCRGEALREEELGGKWGFVLKSSWFEVAFKEKGFVLRVWAAFYSSRDSFLAVLFSLGKWGIPDEGWGMISVVKPAGCRARRMFWIESKDMLLEPACPMPSVYKQGS